LSDILLNIKLPSSAAQVYSSVLDTILLFFDVDTASVMVQEKDVFETVMTSGRLRHTVKSLCIEKNNPMMSQCVEELMPVFIHDVRAIHNIEFPNTITSLHVFPFSHRGSSYGLLILYNSILSSEDSQDILEFCKLMTLVLENLNLQNTYHQYITDTDVLSSTVDQLVPQLHDLDALCRIILHKAIEIVKAEKGSLMLPMDNSLVIKAAEGVNRWLLQDVVIRKGEGIAGKVFKDGRPFFVKNLNEITLLDFKPKSRYKTDSFISVPLTFGSETIGVLNIADKRTGEKFTERDFHLVNRFSSYSSCALQISTDYSLAEQTKKLSNADSLTGLFNRQHFQMRLREEIHRSERYNNVFSFAIIDIDDFILFNDTEGRLSGDNVLREIAEIARKCIRGYDILSRFGGDEFCILMPHTDKNKAYAVAERIRNNVKASLMGRWIKFPCPGVTVSIGISSFPQGGNKFDELTESVDTAIYKAKSMGKDRTVVYSLFYDDTESANAI
jgi:diguanylate cyclase (GGDEF)-like protein